MCASATTLRKSCVKLFTNVFAAKDRLLQRKRQSTLSLRPGRFRIYVQPKSAYQRSRLMWHGSWSLSQSEDKVSRFGEALLLPLHFHGHQVADKSIARSFPTYYQDPPPPSAIHPSNLLLGFIRGSLCFLTNHRDARPVFAMARRKCWV